MLTEKDYNIIHEIVFSDDYPGYKPNVIESPNGDGVWDENKRYAHITAKYLDHYSGSGKAVLVDYSLAAFDLSLKIARELNIPKRLHPAFNRSTIRVLDYPPGSVTNPHTDFDLFTLMLYRDDPSKFKYLGEEPENHIKEINNQVHYGEMMEEIGLAKAHPHEVIASDKRQRSIVYFAIPPWGEELTPGVSVEEWLEERMSRSRRSKQ